MKRRLGFILFALFVTVGMVALPHLLPAPPLPRDFGTAVHFRDGTLMRLYTTHTGRRRYYLPLKRIDPLLVKATLVCEDKRFYHHPGVDLLSIIRAAWQNLKAGHIVSGGSTITLQLVRLLRPGPRTFWRKTLEAAWALGLEARLSKRQILEYYFNLAPYGGNLEGVGAASLAYFGKLPTSLAPDEIAFLISLPQAPIRARTRDKKARNRVLERMQSAGLITQSEALKARQGPIPRHLHPFPFKAPHAADCLYLKYPGRTHIYTTLSPEIQALAEEVIRRHAGRILNLGASATAVVIISNRDRRVRALVGSLDYWNRDFQGQVRGFEAVRSTGSTLKPFLYALALQRGVITPVTRLEDRPRAFGAFRPVDFSPRYMGMVPAKTALARSLNLPFINLLREIRLKAFLKLMKAAGFHWSKNPGLTAVTGGMEASLLSLTNFYVTLARGGRHGPPRLLASDPLREKPLLNPGAAYLTLQALLYASHGMPGPGFDFAWKTGTSFGQRDAWAMGVSPQYTVGVWVGNFNGQGVYGLTGATAALPITFDLIKALGSRPSKFHCPSDSLTWINVCPDSGLPVSAYCPRSVLSPFPKEAPLPHRCAWHRPFIMERGRRFRACPWKTYPPGSLERRVLLIAPGHAPPPFSPACSAEDPSGEIRILSPAAGTLYLLSPRGAFSRGLPLKGITDLPNGRLYWFVNGKLVAKSRSGAVIFVTPPLGRVDIRVMDEEGRWNQVTSWVDYVASGRTGKPCGQGKS